MRGWQDIMKIYDDMNILSKQQEESLPNYVVGAQARGQGCAYPRVLIDEAFRSGTSTCLLCMCMRVPSRP